MCVGGRLRGGILCALGGWAMGGYCVCLVLNPTPCKGQVVDEEAGARLRELEEESRLAKAMEAIVRERAQVAHFNHFSSIACNHDCIIMCRCVVVRGARYLLQYYAVIVQSNPPPATQPLDMAPGT